jgi:hypothetical protein
VPRLVSGDLAVANAHLGIGDQIPYLLGPATAGVVVSWLGGPASLLLPAGALLAAAVLILGVRADRPPPGTRQSPNAQHGIALIWRHPALRALTILTVTYYFAYGPLEPALPVYVRGSLHGGSGLYGGMWTVFGLGALAGLLLVRPLSRLRPGVVNAVGAIAWSVLIAPIAVVRDPVIAAILFFAGAFVWAPYTAIEMSLIQRIVPAGSQGAVIETRRALLVAASPAGAAIGGAFTTDATAAYVIAASAAACAVAGIGSLCSRDLRTVRPSAPARREGHLTGRAQH